jgi:hypothetical protein
MTKRLQGNEDFRISDLSPATAAKVAVQRIRNFILPGKEGVNQAIQLLTAFHGGGKWIFCKSRSLAGEHRFHRRHGCYGVGTHQIRTAAFLPHP